MHLTISKMRTLFTLCKLTLLKYTTQHAGPIRQWVSPPYRIKSSVLSLSRSLCTARPWFLCVWWVIISHSRTHLCAVLFLLDLSSFHLSSSSSSSSSLSPSLLFSLFLCMCMYVVCVGVFTYTFGFFSSSSLTESLVPTGAQRLLCAHARILSHAWHFTFADLCCSHCWPVWMLDPAEDC